MTITLFISMVLIVLPTTQFWLATGLKVLFIVPKQASSLSHFNFAKSIAEVWREKHEVHMLVPILDEKQRLNDEAMEKRFNIIYYKVSNPELVHVLSSPQNFQKYADNWYKPYYDIVNDGRLMAQLAGHNFDAGIAEMMLSAQYAFAVLHALKIPIIMKIKNYTLTAQHLYDLGAIDSIFADGIPVSKAKLGDHDSAIRERNKAANRKIYFMDVQKKHFDFHNWDKHFDQLPALQHNPFPGLVEMFKELRYLLVNTTPETEFDGGKSLSQFEKVRMIGGVALKDELDELLEATPISREIKKKAHGKKGMLLVSFGTVFRVIDKRMGKKEFEILSKVLANENMKDYLIIWQLPQEHPYLRELIEQSKHISNLYANHWLDIQSLLAYKGDSGAGIPPILGFISHCGRNSQIEAHYHGVPLICVPLAYDQMYNAESAAQKQLAIVFDVDQSASFNEANLCRALRELLELYDAPSMGHNRALATSKLEEKIAKSRLRLERVKQVSEAMQSRPKAKKMLMNLMANIERELFATKIGKFKFGLNTSTSIHTPPTHLLDYHAHPLSIDYVTMPNGPLEILAINKRMLQSGKFQLEITGSIRIPGDADYRIVPRSLATTCADKPSYPQTDQVGWLTSVEKDAENTPVTFPVFMYNYYSGTKRIVEDEYGNGQAKYTDYIMNGFKLCVYQAGTTLMQELEMKRFKIEYQQHSDEVEDIISFMSFHVSEKLHYVAECEYDRDDEDDFQLWVKTDEEVAGIKAATAISNFELRKSFNARQGKEPLLMMGYTDAQLATSTRCGIDPKWVNSEGRLINPPNYGYEANAPAQGEADLMLKPGTLLDRYGKQTGKFFCLAGTPFAQRSLPPSEARNGHMAYEVLKSFPVRAGRAVPWFGYPGGAFQYRTALLGGAKQLMEEGFVKVVQKMHPMSAAESTAKVENNEAKETA